MIVKATIFASFVFVSFNAKVWFSEATVSSLNISTPSSKKTKSIHKISAVPRGKNTHWLECANAKEKDIVWKKNGRPLFPNQFQNVSKRYYGISCVSEKDEGNYTCHTKSGSTAEPYLTKIVLKILDTKNSYPCGKPNEELVETGTLCYPSSHKKFPCCKYYAPPAKTLRTRSILKHSYKNCDLYRPMNEIHPWDAQISWELPFYSSDRIWGWQIRLVGLHGDVNFQYCAQINSKDEILNWTIPGLAFGATYTVNLQSLPSGHGKKGFLSNTITKKLTIPSWQDMCTSVGYECKWEICWPVENVTVEIENKAIPIVTWRPSKYHKSVHYYEVSYRNKNSRDYIKVSVQNVTRLILDKIKPQNTTHYYVKVRPVFADYRQGMYSKEIEFIIHPIIVPPGPALNKIIISCSIASSILVFILILLVIRTKNKPNEGKKLKPPPLLPDNEVLIVHDEHCTLCDNVTHSLTNVLNETGYIKCVLDLCCTNEIAEKGYCWYEEKLRNCSKVLVICTKEGRKIYEGRESYNTVKRSSRTYIAILKMILGGKFHNNKTEVVPVCFDHSSHEDIPYFLSDRPFYSLPSEIEKLLMSLSGFNSRTVGDFTEYEIDNTDVLRKKINELKNAIANVGKNHYGNGKVTLVKFFGRSLSGSSTEESSV